MRNKQQFAHLLQNTSSRIMAYQENVKLNSALNVMIAYQAEIGETLRILFEIFKWTVSKINVVQCALIFALKIKL